MHSFYTNKNVVVTGGCGFIGSHIAEKLVSLGANVTIIDNLSTGSEDNIAAIKDKITLIKKSITDMTACLETTRDKEIVFHCAAFISVPDSVAHPRDCYAANVDGTENMLEAARVNGVKRLILSSSAAVYGNYEGTCSETTPTEPTSPYGYSKRIDELLCQQHTKNYGFETVCLRYFNVYGPRQNPNGAYAAVVAKFTDQMKNNLTITIFGDGEQTRDFVPVNQVADANLTLGMLTADTVSGEIFNIGSGQSMSLLQLYDMLKKEFPAYTHDPVFAPERAGDIKYSAADCSKYFSLVRYYKKEPA